MADTIIDRLNRFLGGNPSVQKVSEDVQLTSELLLLIRMIFADGEMQAEEALRFEKICVEDLGIAEKDIPTVVKYLKEFGYETSSWDAAAMFKGMDEERKGRLLLRMLDIAKADKKLHSGETALIRHTAEILGMTPQEIIAIRDGK